MCGIVCRFALLYICTVHLDAISHRHRHKTQTQHTHTHTHTHTHRERERERERYLNLVGLEGVVETAHED